MTIDEFSNEFDVLASSYLLEGGFTVSDSSLYAFNEYEKSLFLTQAQEQYVLSLYNGKNTSADRFEATEEIRRYLHNLVAEYYTTEPLEKNNNGVIKVKNYLNKIYRQMKGSSFKSTLFALPDDVWFITYESVATAAQEGSPACDGGKSIIQDVIPVTQDEFHKIKRNPFRGPSFRRALRLDLSDRTSETKTIKDEEGNVIRTEQIPQSDVVEIISKYDIDSYYVRYIKKVEPIILVDLPEPLKINGKDKACGCQLHEAIHRNILELAVRMAIASRSSLNTNKSSKTTTE